MGASARVHSAPAARRRCRHARPLSLVAQFARHHHGGGGRRPSRQHPRRRRRRHDLRAMARPAPARLSLHHPAANRAHRRHRTAHHQLGGRGNLRRHGRYLHHLPRSGHRQHHAGPHRRRPESHPALRHASRFAGADSLQAALSACAAQLLHRCAHRGGHQRHRRPHGRALRRFHTRRRGRPGLCHHLRQQSNGNRLSLRAGDCRHRSRLHVFLRRHVF